MRVPVQSAPVAHASLERTYVQAIGSFAGAAGLMLAVPFVILAVGLPLALGVRALVEIAERLLSMIR